MLVHSDAELYALLTVGVVRPSFCPSRTANDTHIRYHTPSLSRSALTYRCSHGFCHYFYHVGCDIHRPFLPCFLSVPRITPYAVLWACVS